MPIKLFKSKQASNVDEKAAEIYEHIVRLAEQSVKQANALQGLAEELEATKRQMFDFRNMIQVEKDRAYFNGYQQAIAEASVDSSLLVKQKD